MTYKMWRLIKEYIDARIDGKNSPHVEDYLNIRDVEEKIKELLTEEE